MKMLQKNILIILILLTTSCGYEAIYAKKNSVNYDFSISSINFEGDRNVNLRIKQELNNYMLIKKNREFNLDIKTVEEKIILAKDTAGDATNFQNTVNVNIKVFIGNKLLKNIEIEKNFKYKNITNKYDLGNYVRELKTNLAETIAEELVIKLSNIQ
jgi:outer membrane lipopolysaccharide assembly protein LptE/RlpB